MTEHRTVEERIALWFEEEAAGHLPDQVLEATFDRTRAIRRRPGPSAWRPFTMSRLAQALVAVGAAAIVIIAGAAMLRPPPQSSVVGNSASPVVTASPTAVLTPTLAPSPPSGPPLGLAIVNLDGSIRQELGLPRDAWTADLSADGTTLIFRTSDTGLGFCGGCVKDMHRLAIVRVGENQGTFVYPDLPDDDQNRGTMISPVWSPDGKRIVYSETGVDGNVDLYVADLEIGSPSSTPPLTGAHARRLTTDPAVDEFPAWTPDGSTIVYENAGAHPLDDNLFSDTMEIWSVPAAGGKPTRLTNNELIDTQPDVSADGTVAFWRNGVISAMGIDGSHQRRLLGSPANVFSPRWSPDGRNLALLQYDRSKRASFESGLNLPRDLPLLKVIVVDLATGAVTEVGPRVPSDINPVSWLPDGSALLVYRYDQPS
jgi:WD40 repeat protein